MADNGGEFVELRVLRAAGVAATSPSQRASNQPHMRYAKKVGHMATQNNLHIPADLLSAVNEAASADGKTTDELAADALQRYLAHRKLEELGQYGREQSRRLGYT